MNAKMKYFLLFLAQMVIGVGVIIAIAPRFPEGQQMVGFMISTFAGFTAARTFLRYKRARRRHA